MKKIITFFLTVVAIAILSTAQLGAVTLTTTSGNQIEINTFTIGDANLLAENPTATNISSAVKITIELAPGQGINYVTVYIDGYDKDGINQRINKTANLSGNSSTGIFTGKIAGKRVIPFYTNREYTAEISTSLGSVTITFKGTIPDYEYSDVTFVSISPEEKSEITSVDQGIEVTFSAPVESVTCKCTEGGQGASFINHDNIVSNEDKTVWTIYPGEAIFGQDVPEWTFYIAAKDSQGRAVKGNHGSDDASDYMVYYDCYLGRAHVTIQPVSGSTVEELYEFTVLEPKSISFAYLKYPYLVDSEGNTVATADRDSQVQYDSKGDVIDPDEVADVRPVKMTFNLDKKITAPGNYRLIVPSNSFTIGQEKNSTFNGYQELDYIIKDVETGIGSISAENTEAVYYDLNGRRVLEPSNGIFLKVQGEKVERVIMK